MSDTSKGVPADHTITVAGQTWRLLDPGLRMLNYIGDIKLADGRKFEILGSLSGLAVILRTPFRHPEAGERGPDRAEYILDTQPVLTTLAAELLKAYEPPKPGRFDNLIAVGEESDL